MIGTTELESLRPHLQGKIEEVLEKAIANGKVSRDGVQFPPLKTSKPERDGSSRLDFHTDDADYEGYCKRSVSVVYVRANLE